MTTAPQAIQEELCAPFPAAELSWRAGPVDKPRKRALALPYLSAGVIQQRLDFVLGIGNWSVAYQKWGEKSVLARISCCIGGQWIAKEDGAGETATEAVKGGFSSAFKRAASVWGIGRYLRRIPKQWVPAEQRGESWILAEIPILPDEFLPKNERGGAGRNAAHNKAEDSARKSDSGSGENASPPSSPSLPVSQSPAPASISPQQERMLKELYDDPLLKLKGTPWKRLLGAYGATHAGELTAPDAAALIGELQRELKEAKEKQQ